MQFSQLDKRQDGQKQIMRWAFGVRAKCKLHRVGTIQKHLRMDHGNKGIHQVRDALLEGHLAKVEFNRDEPVRVEVDVWNVP